MKIFDKIKLGMPYFFAPPAANINTRQGVGEYYQPPDDLKAFHGGYRPMFNVSYDGEKNQGSIGVIKRYFINHTALRARSWQAYLESEIAQGFINKFSSWIIGRGLKLQSEPETIVLESEGITNINKQDFSTQAANGNYSNFVFHELGFRI